MEEKGKKGGRKRLLCIEIGLKVFFESDVKGWE